MCDLLILFVTFTHCAATHLLKQSTSYIGSCEYLSENGRLSRTSEIGSYLTLCHLDLVKGQQRSIRLMKNYRCPQLRKQFNSNELGHFPSTGYIALWIVSHGIRIVAPRFLAPILLDGGATFVARISRLAKISSPWEKAQGLPLDHARHGDSPVT